MKKILVAVGAVVLLAVIIILTQQGSNSPQTAELAPLPPPLPKHDTSTWKTYSDDRIAFKYPNDWQVAEDRYDSEGQPVTELRLTNTNREYFYEGSPIQPLLISYRPDVYEGNIQRLYGSGVQRSWLQDRTTTIAGHPAYILQGSSEPGVVDGREVFANGMLYSFDSIGHNPGIAGSEQEAQEITDIFSTVLSTVEVK